MKEKDRQTDRQTETRMCVKREIYLCAYLFERRAERESANSIQNRESEIYIAREMWKPKS